MGRLEAAACLGLFMTGIYATSFGPALPVLARDFGVSLDTAGLLITAVFLGSIAASGLMAARLHGSDPAWLAAGGLLAVAAGSFVLGVVVSWPAALGAALLMGVGDGLLVAGVHTVVARVSTDVARGINRLNVCFAVGAVAGPLWAGGILAADEGARGFAYGVIGAAALATAGALAWARATSRLAPPGSGHAEGGMDRLAWVMGLVLFLYVGAEFGLGSWVASYADAEFDAGIFAGGLITAGYWGALMVGRLISGRLFARGASARSVLLGSVAAGLVASAAIAAANDVFALAVAAAFATGLAFGPIWPAAIAIATEGRTGSAPAAMVTIGNSGGFVFPWLQGLVLVSAGAATGIALSALLCAFMLALAIRAPRRARYAASLTPAAAPKSA